MDASVNTSVAASPTFERMLSLRKLSDPQLSDDGKLLAFVVDGVLPDGSQEKIQSRIWSGTTADSVRQLTHGPGADALPRFSPNASRLAFASDRDDPGRMSLFVHEPGAEARPVGDVPGSIEDIRWLPDGARVVVLAADPGSDTSGLQGATEIGADAEADPEIRRPLDSWRRLFQVDVETGETREVGPGAGLTVWEFSLHGEQAIAVLSENPTEGGWYEGWIGSVCLRSREAKRIYESELQIECPRVSPDGRRLAWIEGYCSDRGIVAGTLSVREIGGGEVRELAPGSDVTNFEWIDGSTLRVCGPRGTRAYVGTVALRDGTLSELYSGPVRLGSMHEVHAVADASAKLFAAVHEAPGVPPELAIFDSADPESGWHEVSACNQSLKELAVPVVDEISWEGDDGLQIEGLLVRPAGSVGPLPMIVNIHGGPTGCWEWSFSPGYWDTAQLFTEAGYAILLPNPRGSSGRGRDFAQANQGDLGGGDFRDIIAGVDACVERGIALADQVGAWGVSYGGYLSAWSVGNTDRFKAIVAVSSISNWLSFHNTANIPAFDRLFLDADPYQSDGRYFHLSPVVHTHKAATPTLLLHGALDKICPLGQAEEMYQALVESDVETELVIYPREGHFVAFEEREHAIDAVDRLLNWMDRHVRGIHGTPQVSATPKPSQDQPPAS